MYFPCLFEKGVGTNWDPSPHDSRNLRSTSGLDRSLALFSALAPVHSSAHPCPLGGSSGLCSAGPPPWNLSSIQSVLLEQLLCGCCAGVVWGGDSC